MRAPHSDAASSHHQDSRSRSQADCLPLAIAMSENGQIVQASSPRGYGVMYLQNSQRPNEMVATPYMSLDQYPPTIALGRESSQQYSTQHNMLNRSTSGSTSKSNFQNRLGTQVAQQSHGESLLLHPMMHGQAQSPVIQSQQILSSPEKEMPGVLPPALAPILEQHSRSDVNHSASRLEKNNTMHQMAGTEPSE